MTDLTQPTTESRKVDHIRINLEQDVQFPNLTTGLEKYRFMHNALPEMHFNEVDTRTMLFGRQLSAPLLISSMTGGTDMAQRINDNLAIAAQEHRLAMGVGSQRAAIEDDALAASYHVRELAPNAILLANVGAVQLNYGYTSDHCQKAIDMIEADAMILHLNVLQEAVQPEGDLDWSGLLRKIEAVAKQLPVPVIAKEVGWGFSANTARQLADAGIAAIDVAGAGGTSWSEVEYHRAPTSFHAQVAAAFADWGIPTAEAIVNVKQGAPDLKIIASGGLRNGLDVAKCIALGAEVGGLASPFLKAAAQSTEAVSDLIKALTTQLRIAMFCTGTRTVADLKHTPLYPSN